MVSVGAFELESVLGRGGSAVVWRARTPGGAPVAVKVSQEPGTTLFRRELNAVAGLDHPAIAMVLDHGVVAGSEHNPRLGLHPGAPYIAMELAGGSLRERSDALDWPEVYAVLSTLLEALAHAHARGILHRDVKPGNVLVGGKRSPYLLTDFGIAHSSDPHRVDGDAFRPIGPLVGTSAFMAPEQCEDRGRDHGPWTDLYAVGGLAWASVTGRPPFGTGLAAVHGHLSRPLPTFTPRFEVPPGLEAWVRRLLSKAPVDRFGRAVEAARELARVSDRAIPTPSWRTPPTPRSLPVAGAGLRLLGLRELRFVGREPVREALWGAASGVVERNKPAAWLIEAPSGFGKSRLARWVCETAHERLGAEVLRALHAPSADPRDGLRTLVEGQLHCAGLDRDAATERVAAALGTSRDDPQCAALTDLCVGRRGRRAALPVAGAVAEWIGALARARPVVVWLDDVQWGLAALELIPRLLALDAPVFVVATVQREALAESPGARAGVDALAARPDVHLEHLGPLGAEEHRELVRSVLEVEHPLATRLAERTAGNPLFAVHLVRDWAERGLLELGPNGFRLRDRGEPPLPGSLASTWTARIDRVLATLPPEGERWLELAAALGPTVDAAEWGAVAGADTLDDLIDALVVAGLAEAGPGTVAFAHGMVREAVLA
ncbi:MAG: AAA family ATPase, partial [Myxococcota bacterium]